MMLVLIQALDGFFPGRLQTRYSSNVTCNPGLEGIYPRFFLRVQGAVLENVEIWDILQTNTETNSHMTYATLAAGGIFYSLNVFFFFFLARPYGLTIANIFIPSSLGGHNLLVK